VQLSTRHGANRGQDVNDDFKYSSPLKPKVPSYKRAKSLLEIKSAKIFKEILTSKWGESGWEDILKSFKGMSVFNLHNTGINDNDSSSLKKMGKVTILYE
jgi:hypothetical protein